ncbi:MAG: aromatic amino acid transaminase [Sphingomonas adhaesiva]|uniref:aromatic amino acid transaminase n=1 Tax=Sphingomonas adhaesiva TaxID=28212 RepID=UPI002FF67A1B
MTDSLFANLREQAPDGLMALMMAFRADPRAGKVDLGVGVYRDDRGNTPVMAAVKAAERILLERQETKVYLGLDGDLAFVDRLAPIVFGDAAHPFRVGMQTPGGTGALRLSAELVAAMSDTPVVWVGEPTWANHVPLFRAAGVEVRTHRFYDAMAGRFDLDAMLADLEAAQPGQALLLHGCCHNPAGVDFTLPQWERIAELVARRRLLPIVDLAYQGLGRGLDEDAAGLRLLADRVEAVVVAYSCDKNFGLYRERTGALWAQVNDAASLAKVRSGIRNPARTCWSMPPDHGAAVVRVILESTELTAIWREELEVMRRRVLGLRERLAASHPALAPLAAQTGMFALLPIAHDGVLALRRDHAIYIADDGRANLAGLHPDMIDPLVAALTPYLG